MGLDFIRKVSGRPYEKRWRTGLERAMTPALTDVSLMEGSRTLTVQSTSPGSARSGATVVVQLDGPDLLVSDGLKRVGRMKAPSDVAAALKERQGMSVATVDRVAAFGGTFEIRLRK